MRCFSHSCNQHCESLRLRVSIKETKLTMRNGANKTNVKGKEKKTNSTDAQVICTQNRHFSLRLSQATYLSPRRITRLRRVRPFDPLFFSLFFGGFTEQAGAGWQNRSVALQTGCIVQKSLSQEISSTAGPAMRRESCETATEKEQCKPAQPEC